MQSVIRLMTDALPCRVRANTGKLGEEVAEYGFNTTIFTGSRREARMKVQICARTMARGIELENLLDAALVKPGDLPLTPTCVSCQRNGGGWLVDGDWHIRIAYYDLVLRARA